MAELETRRFEQVINDSSITDDDRFTDIVAALKDVHTYAKQLEQDARPGIKQQFKDRMKDLADEGYWGAVLIAIPGLFLIFVFLFIMILTVTGREVVKGLDSVRLQHARYNPPQPYYLVSAVDEGKGRCTRIMTVIPGHKDVEATACLETAEAVRLLGVLNSENKQE